MTAFTESDRASFQVQRPHGFNLSAHQPMQITAGTKKLIPTIIRLAQLMAVADPSNDGRYQLNDQEGLEVKIREFRDLVHRHHFPLLGYEEDEFDQLMAETVEQWIMDDWISDPSGSKYYPLLNEIPVSPMGIPDHDIELDDCYDVVALLYWLSGCDPKPPTFKGNLNVGGYWSADEQSEFRLAPIGEILEGIARCSPLSHLPGLIRSVLHQTETFFLDVCPLCGGFDGPDFDWTVENFTWFRDDWRKAKPIYDGNQELIKWSNNNPQRLAEISQILKQAQQVHLFYKNELPEWC